MEQTAQERTEQPTQKKLEESRRHGEVPRSPDLTTAVVVLVAGVGLHFVGSYAGRALGGIMQSSLVVPRAQAFDASSMLPSLAASTVKAATAIAPILGLTLLGALLAPLALGGWNLSFEALAFDVTRLSPANGLKRVLSLRGGVELAKALAKFLLVALVAVLFLRAKTAELMSLGAEPIRVAIVHSAELGSNALLVLASALVLIAAVDVPFQLWSYKKRLRMSRQEIREELKESEGSPEMRGRIRRQQQEVARRRMMQEVPKADVVVTNPTHFAVALRYDDRRMRAPVVVAKGAEEVAARIREVALENEVPIFEAPPLARALHRAVPIGSEIPASLYVAVAQVLTYVYQLRTARRSGAAPPPQPHIDSSVEPADRTERH
jgi:flagellar biosynthesis protein FlhB